MVWIGQLLLQSLAYIALQANVQSSPKTSQGGEGVQSGLGKTETMPHREILDEMLTHILWQQPTFLMTPSFFLFHNFS